MVCCIFLNLHLLLTLWLNLLILFFICKLILLLTFILEFTRLTYHFEKSFLINLSPVKHVINLHHLIFRFILYLFLSTIISDFYLIDHSFTIANISQPLLESNSFSSFYTVIQPASDRLAIIKGICYCAYRSQHPRTGNCTVLQNRICKGV